MKKIKIVGVIIFILSVLIVYISIEINKQSKIKTNILETIHIQKTLVQSISKNTFYSYRQKSKNKIKDISTVQIDKSISIFSMNIGKRQSILKDVKSKDIQIQTKKLLSLWNNFYLDVEVFKRQIKVTIPYTNVLLEKTISRIFSKNLVLVNQFDKLIELQKEYFTKTIYNYKQIQYFLLFLIVLLTLYLFTQINTIISFVQQFLVTSKKVMQNNSIENIEPIVISNNNKEIKNATDNFNYIVDKINESIYFSTKSIDHTSKSIHQIENNIEEFLTLLNDMDKENLINIELTKKEDAVIHSLDELINLSNKLDNLKINLKELIKSSK